MASSRPILPRSSRKAVLLTTLATALLVTACELPMPIPAAPLEGETTPAPLTASAPALTLTPAPTQTSSLTRTGPAATPSGLGDSPAPIESDQMLWLANPNDGLLRLIYPLDGELAALAPSGENPEQVVVGEGAAWALDRINDRVVRVNLEDYSVDAVIPIGQGEANHIAVGLGYVWVGIAERPYSVALLPEEEYKPEGGVLRIDPNTNEIDNYYIAPGPVIDMTVAGDSLWVLSRTVIDTPLRRVNPTDLSSLQIQLGGASEWQIMDAFTVTADSIWVYSQGYGEVYRFSHAGHLYAEVPVGRGNPIGPAHLLEQDGVVWLAAPWGDAIAISAASSQVAGEINLGAPISALISAGGVVWAASAVGGWAYRLDAAQLAVAAQLEIGARTEPTRVVTATAIIRAHRPCEDAPLSRLEVGKLAHTQAEPKVPQRLRREPGTEADTMGWIASGETVRVLEGPECVDGWVWWRVETVANGYHGWASEGDNSDYWLLPGPGN